MIDIEQKAYTAVLDALTAFEPDKFDEYNVLDVVPTEIVATPPYDYVTVEEADNSQNGTTIDSATDKINNIITTVNIYVKAVQDTTDARREEKTRAKQLLNVVNDALQGLYFRRTAPAGAFDQKGQYRLAVSFSRLIGNQEV